MCIHFLNKLLYEEEEEQEEEDEEKEEEEEEEGEEEEELVLVLQIHNSFKVMTHSCQVSACTPPQVERHVW